MARILSWWVNSTLHKTRSWSGETEKIWLVNLDASVGSEIQKTRLYLVVSPSELNANLRTVIVVPMTSKGLGA
jgi:mRNA-degrading endonuclease toxin of MazEF toxin-antitoxin module